MAIFTNPDHGKMKSNHMNVHSSNSTNNRRFTEEDQKRYQEMFAPSVQKFSSSNWRNYVMIGITFAIVCITLRLLPNSSLSAALGCIGMISLFGLLFIFMCVTRVYLKCPACHKNLYSNLEVGNFCPECGASGLKSGDWGTLPHCDSCCKSFVEADGGTSSRIRACTYCGLVFSEKGI